jgi:hypothetical protein
VVGVVGVGVVAAWVPPLGVGDGDQTWPFDESVSQPPGSTGPWPLSWPKTVQFWIVNADVPPPPGVHWPFSSIEPDAEIVQVFPWQSVREPWPGVILALLAAALVLGVAWVAAPVARVRNAVVASNKLRIVVVLLCRAEPNRRY